MTQDLKALRDDLLRLHGALLAAEREAHERMYGRMAPGEWLRMLLHDENFQWLRPISGLVADIDGALAADRRGEPRDPSAATEVLLSRASAVLRPETVNRYLSWLQDSPDVLLAHRAVARHLAPQLAPQLAPEVLLTEVLLTEVPADSEESDRGAR